MDKREKLHPNIREEERKGNRPVREESTKKGSFPFVLPPKLKVRIVTGGEEISLLALKPALGRREKEEEEEGLLGCV